jgi:three-Cys-motif partner protein
LFKGASVSVEYDEIGPWSEVKLDIIREYAAPYSMIMSARGFHHLYIDGFAGPGSHLSRTTGEIVPGSPLNALATEPPFREYHFIDANRIRADQLRELARDRPGVHVYTGDCNDVLLKHVFPRARYEDFRRALCVLDPYNIDLSWEVVATAGRMGSIEIFVNFMVMDMNMNVLLRNPERADPAQLARMNRFWGDDAWRAVTYDTQETLFGPIEKKADDANDRIAEAYRARLIDVAGFKYAPSPLPFLNSRGATIYYLFFASPDPTANKIVQQIFAKYRQMQGL